MAGSVDGGAVAPDNSRPFWSLPLEDLFSSLNASPQGLPTAEAERRLVQHGPNSLRADTSGRIIRLLLRQFGSPIVLLLIGAASLSVILHDSTDGANYRSDGETRASISFPSARTSAIDQTDYTPVS